LGVDVSAHQGRIDWRKVRGDGIAFTYVKATEGGDFVDKAFGSNWAGAHDAGLATGAYHFFTLCTPGRAQAEHFLDTVPPDTGTLPPAVDLELKGNCSRRPESAAVHREVVEFLDAVEARTGRRTVLYVGHEFEDRYPTERLGRPLWLRRFLRRPSQRWAVWQVQGFAHVKGIPGRVDLDVMRRPFR
jgi:lysozyme